MTDHKNTILAIVLSALVLVAWQYFVGLPQMEKQRQEAQLKAQQQQQQAQTPDSQRPSQPAGHQPAQSGAQPQLPGQGAAPTPASSCRARPCSKASPRVAIDTPRLSGSIALKGAAIDDLALTQYHETVDPNSPPIVLLSPAGSPHPFYRRVRLGRRRRRDDQGCPTPTRSGRSRARARSASASRSR